MYVVHPRFGSKVRAADLSFDSMRSFSTSDSIGNDVGVERSDKGKIEVDEMAGIRILVRRLARFLVPSGWSSRFVR